MQDTIQFDSGALNAALENMASLCSESFQSDGGSSRVLLDSIGDTAREINQTYQTLRLIETELKSLFLATVDALRNAGVAFPEADSEAAADFSSISAPTQGGS